MKMNSSTLSQVESLIKENEYVVIDFFATWCGPCQMYYPVFTDVAKKSEIKMITVDVDQENQLASTWGIRSLPTTIIIKNGKELTRHIGYQSEDQLKVFVKSHTK